MHGNTQRLFAELLATEHFDTFITDAHADTEKNIIKFKTINNVTVTIYLHSHRFMWQLGNDSSTVVEVSGLSDVKFDFENGMILFQLNILINRSITTVDFLAMKV
jgi:hypothetical protein